MAIIGLPKRDQGTCTDAFGYERPCNWSNWKRWGRWVALVVILIVFFLCVYVMFRTNARRRRRQGLNPIYGIYGTGWTAPGPAPPYSAQPPPPQYTPTAQGPPPGGYYAAPPYAPYASYGPQTYELGQGPPGHPGGIELQPPTQAHYYDPPSGPPPTKFA